MKAWVSIGLLFSIVLGISGCQSEAVTRLSSSSSLLTLEERGTIAAEVREAAAAHGVTPVPAPAPVSDELFVLGQALAFDKVLSGNQDTSCFTCHHPTLGTSDGRSLPIGVGGVGLGPDRVHPEGRLIPRNAPQIFNAHARDSMFWDSRLSVVDGVFNTPAGDELIQPEILQFGALSAQALFPVTSEAEMLSEDNKPAQMKKLKNLWKTFWKRLRENDEYMAMFEAAYPGERTNQMTLAYAANAIAAFEATAFYSNGAPFDRFMAGDDAALSDEALLGAQAFFREGSCGSCHSGSMLTDLEHHKTLLSQLGPGRVDGDDIGRAEQTGEDADRYAFRTPSLQNVALTGPWGHAGQITDLETFVRHYIDPFDALETWDPTQLAADVIGTLFDNQSDVLAAGVDPLAANVNIDESDVPNLVAFLHALTDPKFDMSTEEGGAYIESLIPERVPSGLPVAD